MSPTGLAMATVARREDVLALAHHFDRHHHAFVFVLYDVTVKHEPPHDHRISEGNDKSCLTRFSTPCWRNTEGVAQALEMRSGAIDFGDQKSGLMDVKIMVLAWISTLTSTESVGMRRTSFIDAGLRARSAGIKKEVPNISLNSILG